MRWGDNLLLEGDVDPIRGQLQLAMYAIHLSTGHSIYCKQIKAKTIESYVKDVASFLALFSGRDFRKDNPTDKHMGSILASVYKDLHAFESLPNRREPYTLQMHTLATTEAAIARRSHPWGLVVTLTDGFASGINAGFRLSEWAQPAGNRDPSQPLLAYKPKPDVCPTKAIVPNDIVGHTTDLRRLVGLAIVTVAFAEFTKMLLEFRYQKNGQNGEIRLFTHGDDPDSPHSMMGALYRSLQRFAALRQLDSSLDPASTPLFLYWDERISRVCLVTSTEIETFMRSLASKCYALDPVTDKAALQRWSSHSLRVGACVLLHAMGFPPQDIKWLLRWLSDAFLTYLRNTAILATKHSQALDQAAAMPNLV